MEIWKDITNWVGCYQVSTYGQVRSLDRVMPHKRFGTKKYKGKILRTSRLYPQVILKRPGIEEPHSVHRLVLEAFVGPCPDGMEGCHNDGNPRNCSLDNLRWDTKSNNNMDKVNHGTLKRGTSHYLCRYTEKDIKTIRNNYALGKYTQAELARIYKTKQSCISAIINRIAWKHI